MAGGGLFKGRRQMSALGNSRVAESLAGPAYPAVVAQAVRRKKVQSAFGFEVLMEDRCKIIVGNERLTIVGEGGQEMYFPWQDVYAVSFCKVDAITFELTFLRFDAESGYLEAHEQMEGWDLLLTDLPKHLPIGFPDWQIALRNAVAGAPVLTIFKRK